MNLATSTMGSLTQKSSKSVQYFKNYVKICKFKAKLGAPQHTVVVSSFDQAKHRNQNQVFEDSVAETPRLPERPNFQAAEEARVNVQAEQGQCNSDVVRIRFRQEFFLLTFIFPR